MFIVNLSQDLQRVAIITEEERAKLHLLDREMENISVHGVTLYLTWHVTMGDLCQYMQQDQKWLTYDCALPTYFYRKFEKDHGRAPVGAWVYGDDQDRFGRFVSYDFMIRVVWARIMQQILTGQSVATTVENYIGGLKHASQ